MRNGTDPRGRRRLLVATIAVVIVAFGIVLGFVLTRHSQSHAVGHLQLSVASTPASMPGTPDPPPLTTPLTTTAPSPTSSTQPATTTIALGGPYDLQNQIAPTAGDCQSDSRGDVQTYLVQHQCIGLSRALYTARASGRLVLVSAAAVAFADPSVVPAFISLDTADNTGDIWTLVDSGLGGPGDPSSFATDPTFLAYAGQPAGTCVVLEAMWMDGGTTHANDPALVAVLNDAAKRIR